MSIYGEGLLCALPGHDVVAESCRTIQQWLLENARHFGDRPAVEGIGRPPLSHAGLHHHIDAIAEYLLAKGIGRGDIVMVSLANGPEALTAILAVASVAVAFPVGLEEPADLIERVMHKVPVKAVLFAEDRQAVVKNLGEKHSLALFSVTIDKYQPAGVFKISSTHPRLAAAVNATQINDAAILVKTAGTTAEPKIVAWSQASLYLSADTAAAWMELNKDDRSLCMMPFSHLHSVVRSTMPGLLRGGAVFCCPGFDKIKVLDCIIDFRVSYMTAVPGIYRTMLERMSGRRWQGENCSLRFLASGSDSIDDNTVEALAAAFSVPVREFYGMSEVAPMLAATPAGQMGHLHGAVGKPLFPWSITIRDENGQLQTPGSAGEIIARGGLINPLIEQGGATVIRSSDGWYCTGDRGWIDADGCLHVSGRVDERITRGGKKIAPEAVDEVLASYTGIRQAVTFPMPDEVLGERVAAVVVPECGVLVDTKLLRAFVAGKLPDYMVPEQFFMCDSLPAGSVGKVIRKGMAKLLHTDSPRGTDNGAGRRETRSLTETTLVSIFRALLETEDFDLETDFMDLGGDSFAATSLLVAIEDSFGVLLSPPQFFANGSVASLAHLIDELSNVNDRPRIITVQAGKGKIPLFFAHGPGGTAIYASTFAKYLGPAQTIYAFQWQEPDANDEMTMETHAAYYVDAMRSLVPSGPYYLVGHSFGAQMAFEVARQLTGQGREVAFLAILDDEADLYKRRFGLAARSPKSASVYQRCKHLLHSYTPETYAGPVTLFQAEIQCREALSDPYVGWKYLVTGNVERVEVTGDHNSMMSEDNIEQWAALFAACLERAYQGVKQLGPDAERAARLQESASEHNKRTAIYSATLARRAAKTGNIEAEIAHYRQAISCDGDHPYWLYRNLGAALLQNGDTEGGLEYYRLAAAQEQIPIMGYSLLAGVLNKLGRPDDARRFVEDAQACEVDTGTVHYALGRLLLRHKILDVANERFRRAISMQPKHPKAYRYLSEVLSLQGCHDEAIQFAKIATKLAPDEEWFWHHLGKLLAADGDLEASARAYRKAIDEDKSFSEGYYRLSEILFRQGQWGEAIDQANMAINLSPENFWFRHHLGDLLASKKNIIAAVEAHRHAFALRFPNAGFYRYFFATISSLRTCWKVLSSR